MFPSWLLALVVAIVTFAQAVEFMPFLNFTSPAPYMFHSLATLLQTYPQTLFPNGHTITSVTIPRGTLLYHGRHDNDAVPSPEWLALDIEMAYGIMGNLRDSRMLTYRTTKDVQLVYFDGTSASLMGEGTASQMVLLYNGTDNIPHRGGWGPPRRGDHNPNVNEATKEADDEPPRRPPGGWNPLEDEYVRARGLCKWMKKYGLREIGTGFEGVVRMNAGFEVIWCDFESPSLKLVSNLNVSAPLLEQDQSNSGEDYRQTSLEAQTRLRLNDDEGPHGPGMTDPREPFRGTSNWFWFAAAAKRYHIESRIKLNPCGLFSFYEHQLRNQSSARVHEDTTRLNLTSEGQWQAPAGVDARIVGLDQLMKRRRQHYLSSVSNKDAFAMFTSLKRRLSIASGNNCAGTDWAYVAREIVARYSNEIQQLQQLLSNDTRAYTRDWDALIGWFASTRSLTHWFLLPFLEYPPDRPYRQEDLQRIFALDSAVAKDTLMRCVTQYDTEETIPHEQYASYTAVKETLTGLCSTVVAIGLQVEFRWLSDFNGRILTKKEQRKATMALLKAAQSWKNHVEELMAWLGWVDKWISCEDRCGTGEICYIPMWPTSGFPRRPGRGPHRPPPGGDRALAAPHFDWGEWNQFLWEPVCVNASTYPPEQWTS